MQAGLQTKKLSLNLLRLVTFASKIRSIAPVPIWTLDIATFIQVKYAFGTLLALCESIIPCTSFAYFWTILA